MALSPPTNINLISNTNTSFRFTYQSNLPSAGRLYLFLTPRFYTEFTHELNGAAVASGNRNNNVTFQWSNAIFNNVMRGISYNLSIGLKTNDNSSAYVPTGIVVKRPFFQVSDEDITGFSIASISIPENRTSDSVFSTDEIEYIGSWHSYPKITLVGRFNYCKLVNTGSGAEIGIDTEVSSGHFRVIDTNPLSAQYSIYGGNSLSNLENVEHELTGESNIRDFIFPASNMLKRPLAIEAYFFNRNNTTRMDVSFPIRYYELGENYT